MKRALNGGRRMERDDVLPAQATPRHKDREVLVLTRRCAPLFRA